MIVGLDHAFSTIPSGREDDARRFYGQLLGLDEIARPEGLSESDGLWFQVGGQELHLGTDDEHEATKRPHPGLRVETVTALEESKEAGLGLGDRPHVRPAKLRDHAAARRALDEPELE